ncbi:OmpA family protein [Draconibacterium sp. IB214405]|uniref:OmpA family protein n=1 Tax=Draconibacterium sp. IB214405 TaxID=3097352 RepID=UPI002A135184|nr:OmpA family protein [Draconibacterium sp. IB214405]MDX8341180.1 OmpA family protein [Draconibacterium sp. IB214405]
MKRVLLILIAFVPMLALAQQKCVYFEKMVKLETEKTDLNTTQSDFGPGFVGDELWYSAFTDEEIEKLNSGSDKKIYYNLYSTPTDSKGNVKTGKTVKLESASEGYHAGPVSYCEATGELFVTLSNFENPEVRNKVYQKADIRLKIIIAKKVNGEWQKTGELPFNDPTYSVGHPSITASGDTLFFVSDIPDKGFGGTDIYMSVRSNGSWGEMQNMGETINTDQNEMFPFIHKGKFLIFSSNGRGSGDDLDIYNVGMFGGNITGVAELTELNSDGDDFGFVIHPDEEIGYYCSNKEGGMGSDDIYKVLLEKLGSYDLELVVMDKKTMEPVQDAKITFGGVAKAIVGLLFKQELEKDKSYNVATTMDGYMNDSKTISTVGKPFGVIKDTLWIEKVKVGQKFVMENIYYDFDKWDILPESEVELDKLVKVMNDNPDWKVELGSHTDCRGSDEYNKVLSQKRSDSAVGYIVSKGISADRITAMGYGETQLVNECDDGVACSEADHRKNRRTEFKILEMNGN